MLTTTHPVKKKEGRYIKGFSGISAVFITILICLFFAGVMYVLITSLIN